MCKMYLCGFVGALIPGWNGRVFDESVVAGRRSIYPPVRFLLAATRGQCLNNFIIFSNIQYFECYCFLCKILETDFAIALFVIILLTAQPNRMILPVKKADYRFRSRLSPKGVL